MISVKYSGPWSEASGYAQANRNIIQSLHENGIDVITELQQYAKQDTDYGQQLEICKSYQNKHNNYPIKVLHITPNVYAKHKEVGKYHIGHLFWETTKMNSSWAWYLNEVREIWTGCEENVKTFREMGFEGKIFKFPQPIETNISTETKPIDNVKGFIFGSIFQWIERKDPKSLLTAYWKEFQNDDNVTLVIKTYGLGFEDHEFKKIKNQIIQFKKEMGLPHYPRTIIAYDLLTTKEIHKLHEAFDCYVSSHRFEGWGIPIVESLVHSKPVISTNLGGIHEWISDNGMIKVGYNIIDVSGMDWAEQYIVKDNKWAQINIDELRQKMRWVYENRDEAKKIGLQGQKEVKEKLNFKTVGKLMENRMKEIYQEQGFS